MRLSVAVTADTQRAVERFYAYEARLLDERQYQQWLALLSESISYIVPARVNAAVDNRQRGNESMLAVANELERADGEGCPLREESYIHLMLRVERAYKPNSWSENPPARTRRLVANIEVMEATEDSFTIWSHFHLHYARPGSRSCLYSGQRKDVIVISADTDAGFQLAGREVILDYADIELPTVGLLF